MMICDRPRMTGLVLLATLSLAACSESGSAPSALPPYTVEEVPLHQVSVDLASGRTTSEEVTRAYIERIEALDGELNAVILVAPDALDQAAASDARRAAGQELGPLDGVPMLFKDNLDAVGMPTTAGSFALEDNYPEVDSEVVRRLRGAGVVILGKANLSQFAGFRNSASLNGSTLGGGTHNPYDVTRSAAGSSNGSGISTAMSFAAATIGTETAGSIIGPSSVNGVVGMKPTIALVSRRGIVPISLTQDSSGPMTRTVWDAAMILNIIAGSDPDDAWSAEADINKADYVAALDSEALQGSRLGVLRPTGDNAESIGPLFDAALEALIAQGADLVDMPEDALVDPRPEMRIILIHDFKEDLNTYLGGTPGAVTVRTLADLIEFSRTDPRESMHTMDLWEDAEATVGGRQNPEYIAALEAGKRLTQQDGIDRLLSEYDVVALIAPSGNPASELQPDGTPRPGPIPSDPRGTRPASLTTTAAVAGYPLISVPMGLVEGLPVGLSFVGTAWSESLLLSLAYDYEQASQSRITPHRAVVSMETESTDFVSAVQEAVWAVDANLPRYNIETMDALVERRIGGFAIIGNLMGIFALLSLVLGAVGIYGITVYSAGQHTSKIGIRLAMGAKRGDVVRMVVSQGAKRAGFGLVIGLGLAFAMGGAMSEILVGVSPTDTAVFGGVTFVLAAVSFVGLYLPARRVSRTD
jgi:amidase